MSGRRNIDYLQWFSCKDESVSTAWGNLQAQYQRRADLIPNLVSTVKGYAKHESSTLENVIAARAKATQLTVSADELTPQKFKKFKMRKVSCPLHLEN